MGVEWRGEWEKNAGVSDGRMYEATSTDGWEACERGTLKMFHDRGGGLRCRDMLVVDSGRNDLMGLPKPRYVVVTHSACSGQVGRRAHM